MIEKAEDKFESLTVCIKYYACVKQSEIFHALQFNLTGWLIDLDAALKVFFHFKLKAETLRLHTSPSALTSFTHF